MLAAMGKSKKAFYDPGTAQRFSDKDNWQNPLQGATTLWSFGDNLGNPPQGFHITGYLFTFSGSLSCLIKTNQNKTLQLEPIIGGPAGMGAPNVSDRVLTACATISDSTSDHQGTAVGTYNFTKVGGGFYLPHLSPHLKGSMPTGGTVGFKDGHAQWRKFKDMDERAASGKGFWW